MLAGHPRRSRPSGGRGVSRLVVVVVAISTRLVGDPLGVSRARGLASPSLVTILVMVETESRGVVVAAAVVAAAVIAAAVVVVAAFGVVG